MRDGLATVVRILVIGWGGLNALSGLVSNLTRPPAFGRGLRRAKLSLESFAWGIAAVCAAAQLHVGMWAMFLLTTSYVLNLIPWIRKEARLDPPEGVGLRARVWEVSFIVLLLALIMTGVMGRAFSGASV